MTADSLSSIISALVILVCATRLVSGVLGLSWYNHTISHIGVHCFTPVPLLSPRVISFAQSSLRTQRPDTEQRRIEGRKGSRESISCMAEHCPPSLTTTPGAQGRGLRLAESPSSVFCYCLASFQSVPRWREGRTWMILCCECNQEELQHPACHPHICSKFWSVVSQPKPSSEQPFWDVLYSGRSLPQTELQTLTMGCRRLG